MTQKSRKEPGKTAAKKAPAKKAAPTDAVPTPEETPSPQKSQPADAATGDTPSAPTVETSTARPSSEGTVVDSGSSSRTDRTDTVDDGERQITTTSVETRHTTREYEHGRRVEETVTVTTSHRERIPVPYAGPISDHPAPVG